MIGCLRTRLPQVTQIPQGVVGLALPQSIMAGSHATGADAQEECAPCSSIDGGWILESESVFLKGISFSRHGRKSMQPLWNAADLLGRHLCCALCLFGWGHSFPRGLPQDPS